MKLLFVSLMMASASSIDFSDCSRYKGNSLKEDHRIYKLLKSLQEKTTPKFPVSFCVCEKNEKISEVRICCYPWKKVTIIVTQRILDDFSDTALNGVLAHELGHVHLDTQGIYTNEHARELAQQKVDAFAIRLVGEESLKKAYLSYTNNKKLAERRVFRAKKLIRDSIRQK